MNAQLITHTEFVELLKQKKGERSLRAVAAEYNVSHQYLAKVLAGDVEAGPAIATVLGYEAVSAFRRVQRDDEASLPRCTALHSRTRRKCVRPSGHPGNEHEDVKGKTWISQPRGTKEASHA